MPVHDWTRVDAGIFHAFHLNWLGRLQDMLNDGIMPSGYYALAEQHAGRLIPDLLTLKVSDASKEPASPPSAEIGGTAVADAPPRMRRKHTVETAAKGGHAPWRFAMSAAIALLPCWRSSRLPTRIAPPALTVS